jgi:hypothetical protein
MIYHRHESGPDALDRIRPVCSISIGGVLSGVGSALAGGAQAAKAITSENEPVSTAPQGTRVVTGRLPEATSDAIEKNREALNDTRQAVKRVAAQNAARFNSFVSQVPSPRTNTAQYQPQDANTELDRATVTFGALAIVGLLIMNASDGG